MNPSIEPNDRRDRTIRLRAETVDRVRRLRAEGQSEDELITELINIYATTERLLAHSGDAL
jgi:hypothetical protein